MTYTNIKRYTEVWIDIIKYAHLPTKYNFPCLCVFFFLSRILINISFI